MTCVIKYPMQLKKNLKKKNQKKQTKTKTKKIFKIYYINFQHEHIEFFSPKKFPDLPNFLSKQTLKGNLFFFFFF